MCPTKVNHHHTTTTTNLSETCSSNSSSSEDDQRRDWREEVINNSSSGSLRHVDLNTGTNGWASPPGHLFNLRSNNFFTKKTKSPSGDWLLKPAGVDWLRSTSKLDNLLARPDNRIMKALQASQSSGHSSMKTFVFAVNLQVPGRENHNAVFYFVTDNPIPVGSLFYKFIHEEDDQYRNNRFKIVNRIVKGPWIVKAAVGNHAACLLGKALTCKYYRGENYLEIDVDIGSSALASAILHLALKYVTAVSIDMGFLVEAQTEEELPERLLGAVRIAHIEMSSATFVESAPVADVVSLPVGNGCCGGGGGGGNGGKGKGSRVSKVNHHCSESSQHVRGGCGGGGGDDGEPYKEG